MRVLWLLMLAGVAVLAAARLRAAPIGCRAVSRDACPVCDDPDMLTVTEARKLVFDRDAMAGVVHRG